MLGPIVVTRKAGTCTIMCGIIRFKVKKEIPAKLPMKLADAVRKLVGDDRRIQYVLLTFMVLFYGVILHFLGTYWGINRTFNSMLDHLVHGQFDVDPDIIGVEGFVRNGHVFSYWGITCALVRLPLLPFNRLDLDVTAYSCLAAVCLAGLMRVRTVLFLRRYCSPAPGSEGGFVLMLVYIILGGAGVGYLKASPLQEVIFWAIAFAEIFVYFAVKGLVSGQFTVVTLSWMALAAGMATLTRVSTGLGLCAALGLLLAVLLVQEFSARRAVLTSRFLVPAAVLAALCIVVGTINYFRWGNPTTFADYTRYIWYHKNHDQMLRFQLYGNFNLARVPFGLGYYFSPLWALRGANGRLLFADTQTRLLNGAELPPSSLFFTDFLPMVFIVFLAMALSGARPIFSSKLQNDGIPVPRPNALQSSSIFSHARGLALATGLAVPCVLMLTAIYMSYRYRMEFYPEMDLLGFLGLYATVSNPALLLRFNRFRRWMLAAAVISIVSAFMALALYWRSPWGESQVYLRNGLAHYYLFENVNHDHLKRLLAPFLSH